MRSRPKPAPTPQSRRASLLVSSLAFMLMTSACARPASSVVTIAPAPRLEVPPAAREKCPLSILAGDLVADLAVAYRERGVDLKECEGRRALAVQTIDEEHRLEDLHAAAREERNRSWWQRLTPWRE